MRKLLCILNLVLSCEVSTAWAQFAPVNEQRAYYDLKQVEPNSYLVDETGRTEADVKNGKKPSGRVLEECKESECQKSGRVEAPYFS